MENLTNEQIVEIIKFYKDCGITEDMYLSNQGVLDMFSLLGIEPSYDKNGERIPTVYELIGIPPKFHNGKEVPIIFAIKHKVSGVCGQKVKIDKKLTYSGSKEVANDRVILNKLKKDYFSALTSGNMIEAARLYDLIDMLTGGKGDEFIGIQYECVKFYKKMQKQLLMDMFANFIILLALSKKLKIKEGLVKFDKLYKLFVEKELKNASIGIANAKNMKLPEISKITVTVADNTKNEKTKVEMKSKQKMQQIQQERLNAAEKEIETKKDGLISFVKSKFEARMNKIKNKFSTKKGVELEESNSMIAPVVFDKNDKSLNILEK